MVGVPLVQDCLRLPIVATVETAESRYRHPRHHLPGTVEVLRRLFANPMPLMAGAEAAGDPIAVLPVLFHLLWCHELTIALSTRLHQATLVSPSASQR